jgi:hypothetical protein
MTVSAVANIGTSLKKGTDMQSSLIKRRCRAACLISALLASAATALVPLQAQAATVTFRWDYGASGAAGFMLYCGNSSKNYSLRVDVGNTDAFAISTLQEGAIYFCAVTAYDPAKAESTYSNEVALQVPSTTPAAPDLAADLNHDGVADLRDLQIFWLRITRNDPRADLNGDGVANTLDLGLFKQLFDNSAEGQ